MTEKAITVLLVVVPWAILGLVALLRGYEIHVVRDRRRNRYDDERKD